MASADAAVMACDIWKFLICIPGSFRYTRAMPAEMPAVVYEIARTIRANEKRIEVLRAEIRALEDANAKGRAFQASLRAAQESPEGQRNGEVEESRRAAILRVLRAVGPCKPFAVSERLREERFPGSGAKSFSMKISSEIWRLAKAPGSAISSLGGGRYEVKAAAEPRQKEAPK